MSKNKIEALKCSIDIMEKETLYFTGRKRARARRKYLRLVRSYEEIKLNEPIHLKRK